MKQRKMYKDGKLTMAEYGEIQKKLLENLKSTLQVLKLLNANK